MKNQRGTKMAIVLVPIALVAITVGTLAGQEKADKTSPEEVTKEVKEATEAIRSYSSDQRDEALKKVKAAIDDLDTRIDELERRLEKTWDQADQKAREKARATLKSLRRKRNDLAEWYGGMQHSSAKAWQHVKRGFLNSYEALAEAYDKAVREF
jgi:flagellar motility protein MotE (MotC chaperone)